MVLLPSFDLLRITILCKQELLSQQRHTAFSAHQSRCSPHGSDKDTQWIDALVNQVVAIGDIVRGQPAIGKVALTNLVSLLIGFSAVMEAFLPSLSHRGHTGSTPGSSIGNRE